MRDYLNAHADKAKEYSTLKMKLATEFPNDRSAYTIGKSELIKEILESAERWKRNL